MPVRGIAGQPSSEAAIARAAATTSAVAFTMRLSRQAGQRRRNADRRDDVSLRVTDRRRDTPHVVEVFAVVECVSRGSDARTDARELRQRDDRVPRIGVERHGSEQRFQRVEIHIGHQRLAMGGAVERHELAGLSHHRDDMAVRRVMVDEEHLGALAHGDVRGLADLRRQRAQVFVKERAEQGAAVFPRQPPGGRPEDIVLAADRIRRGSGAAAACSPAGTRCCGRCRSDRSAA